MCFEPGSSQPRSRRRCSCRVYASRGRLRPPPRWMTRPQHGCEKVSTGGRHEWLARPEDGKPVKMRMNDACADPAGRFWAVSMAYDFTPEAGSLYRVDRD